MERSLSTPYDQSRPRAEGFSFRRLGLVAGLDLKESLSRPLFLIFALIMLWNGYLMSRGSWIFRSKVRSGFRNRFFASCWVKVEPPWTTAPERRLVTIARAMPIGSMPK